MSEERLQTIGVVRYAWIINIFEHVWECPLNVNICPSYIVVCVCHLTCLLIDSLLLDELLILVIPLSYLFDPEQLVIGSLYMTYLADKSSEGYSS